MAADRYISRKWLLETLAKYKDIGSWNTEVCDADTISRVLDVVENAVNGAPSIGPRQCANKILAAKNMALEVNVKMLKDNVERAKSQYRQYESVGNDLLMGFYRGIVYAREESVLMLERLVQDG